MQKLSIKKRKKDRGAKIFYITMIALPLLQFLVFYIVVNFNSILLAFQNYNAGTGKFEFVGFDWFKTFFYNLFNNKELGISLRNSLIYCGLSLVVVRCKHQFASYSRKSIFEWKQFRHDSVDGVPFRKNCNRRLRNVE